MHKTSNLDLKKASAAAAAAASLPSSSALLSRNKYDKVAMLLLGCANEKHQGHTEPNYPALFSARITRSWFWQRCCRGCVCLSIRSPNSLVFDFWVAQQNKPAAVSKHPAILCTPTPPSPCRIVSRRRRPAVPAVPF